MDMTELLKTENNAYKRKLQSKSEALAILQNQLLAYQQELDQLRRSRGSQHNGQHWQNQQQPNGQHYTNLQSQQQTNQHTPTNDNGDGLKNINATQIRASNVEFANRKLMDENKLLRFDVEDLKQKLNDATNDIKVLRKQQTMMKISGQALEKGTTSHSSCTEHLEQLEHLNRKTNQLEQDLQILLDDKQDLIKQRDLYFDKMQRLNVQIKNLLNISSPNVDFDAILMENKYLKQRLEDVLSEKKTWTKTVSKYKSMLSNNCQTTGKILSYDQIAKHINTMTSSRSSTQPDVTNLKQICITLLDTLNEKNLLLQHQRKTNKILANRILELEKQTRGQDTCEVLLRGYSAGVSSETAEWDSKDREANETTTLNKPSKDDDEPSKRRPSEDTIKGIEEVDKNAENGSMKCDNSTSHAAIEKEKVVLEKKICDSSRTPEGGMNCTGLECLRRNKTDNLSDAKELSENARDPIDGLGIRKPLDNDIKQVGNHNHVNKQEDFHEQTNNRKRVQGPAESQVIKDGKSIDRELSFEEHEDIQSLPIELQKLVLQAMKDLEKDELKSV
ncbi:hypothetical protein M8J76_015467 [Diaphorina citri]|nr:hypothetical protein M8J75_006425 [Diaphorina citri]KAI5733750.1 hypothetical protein M8J76_015467 [Diaphorina citri]